MTGLGAGEGGAGGCWVGWTTAGATEVVVVTTLTTGPCATADGGAWPSVTVVTTTSVTTTSSTTTFVTTSRLFIGEAKVPAANRAVVSVEKRISITGVDDQIRYWRLVGITDSGRFRVITDELVKNVSFHRKATLRFNDSISGRAQGSLLGGVWEGSSFDSRKLEQMNELLGTLERMKVYVKLERRVIEE